MTKIFFLTLMMSVSSPHIYAQSTGSTPTSSGTSSGTTKSGYTGVSGASDTTSSGSLEGRSSGSMGTSGRASSTGTTITPSTTTTDEVGTSQPSTLTTDCIQVTGQGKLCGSRAASWCRTNSASIECRNFSLDNADNTNSTTSPSTSPTR